MNPTKYRGELRCSGRLAVSAPLVTRVELLLNDTKHHLIWKSCWTTVYGNTFKSNPIQTSFLRRNRNTELKS